MPGKTIYVGKLELLEWLAGWGTVEPDDELLRVKIGYGHEVEFVVGTEEDDEE